jgi:hypothetical protein
MVTLVLSNREATLLAEILEETAFNHGPYKEATEESRLIDYALTVLIEGKD